VLERNVTLTSKFLDKNYKCYKGNIYGNLKITKQHFNHKIGEFFFTKISGGRIAYRKKQKQLSKGRRNKFQFLNRLKK
jgi:ribosomal protein S19